jgi:phosphoribosylanthranilate isomerase
MKIKLCGFTKEESVIAAIENNCDFLGFVFYDKSPRNLDLTSAESFLKIIPSQVKKVAVVVNSDFDFLEKINSALKPDFFQFHGDEDIGFLAEVRKKFPLVKIIKSFKIKDSIDVNYIKSFNDFCDFFLFDNQNAGSGKKFDWQILKNINIQKEWFLSGGINIDNIEEAIKITGAKFVDISSGIEETRGVKSIRLIEELMNKINNVIKN